MDPTKPTAKDYQNERWVYFKPSPDKILILSEHETLDSLSAHQNSVPWGLVVAEIPIHRHLLKCKAFAPCLKKQHMHAALMAQAPQLLTLNTELHKTIENQELEIELLKQIIQNLKKTGPAVGFPTEFNIPKIIKS